MDANFLEIDPDRLDQEWLGQSGLVFEIGMRAAQARRDFDDAKSRLEVVEAELYLSIKNSPSEFNLSDKPTETTVKSAIVIQESYKDIMSEVAASKYSLDIAQAAVNAMEHRKKALENLVELDSRNYHSEPKTKTETSREYKHNRSKQEANRKVREANTTTQKGSK